MLNLISNSSSLPLAQSHFRKVPNYLTLLTIDIEDHFHTHENRQNFSGHMWDKITTRVEGNTMRILDMLDEIGVKATFFVLGWVATQHPQLIKRISNAGHEIGSHSYWHHNANRLVEADFEKDLVRSISAISDITGKPVEAYRAPGFSIRKNVQALMEILAANGIKYDSSMQMKHHHATGPFKINTNSGIITEFPLIKSKLGVPYTGGGYYRALPHMAYQKLFMENPAKGYKLLYFHPRDFDRDNPYTNLFSMWRNILNGYNTSVCMERLKNYLQIVDVVNISQAVKIIENTKE